ncbi:MAG: hypothetical protein KA717_16885 [Woronichinia naegeliana WA131]|jgi:hypothetical protein|uniref:Uncharacterized protein n=1 Tax=Woronichinia naegeliana WA131 TaxID=2824559 RepID=A0A977L1W1_9CYAN|nr:MAG: hypothetical protein KA717_16885 [Woronichinia naegeliana WA131]
MEITRHGQDLTPEEQQELARLHTLIEKAIADNVISKAEEQSLRAAALAGNPSPELLYQELQLYRRLVTEKVNQGLLVAEKFDQL